MNLPFESEEFADAWGDWVKHRSEIRKPLKPTAIKLQFRNMLEWGEAASIESIEKSIMSGWQGLFKPRATEVMGDVNARLIRKVEEDGFSDQ